jgi:two-component system response regulator YesN
MMVTTTLETEVEHRGQIKLTGKHQQIVDTMLRHINQHYMEPNLSVETLVDITGLSTNYVRRVFKAATSQSFSEYTARLRFQKVKELLTETDLPAVRIGERVGFINTSYFYVSFKKFTGKTPDLYRKHNKKATN